MDYLTIHINKTFLIRVVLVALVTASWCWSVKYAYKRGMIAALEFIIKNSENKEELSVPERSEAPLNPQDGEPGRYKDVEL